MINKSEGFLLLDIVLIDIVKFSRLSNQKQLELISHFNKLYKRAIELVSGGIDMVEGFIPTGDGFYMLIKKEYRGCGLVFAISLKNMAEKFKRDIPFFSGIRIAIHNGYLIPITDVSGRINYLGNGLNDCSRYSDFRIDEGHPFYDDGFIIASDAAINAFEEYCIVHPRIRETISFLGYQISQKVSIKDKHGSLHQGHLVKTEKYDIIVLNSVPSEEKRQIIKEYGAENDPFVLQVKQKIKEYEEKLENFYKSSKDYAQELDECQKKIASTEEKISGMYKKIDAFPKESVLKERLKKLKEEHAVLLGQKKEFEQKQIEHKEAEQKSVPVLQALIKKEREIILSYLQKKKGGAKR